MDRSHRCRYRLRASQCTEQKDRVHTQHKMTEIKANNLRHQCNYSATQEQSQPRSPESRHERWTGLYPRKPNKGRETKRGHETDGAVGDPPEQRSRVRRYPTNRPGSSVPKKCISAERCRCTTRLKRCPISLIRSGCYRCAVFWACALATSSESTFLQLLLHLPVVPFLLWGTRMRPSNVPIATARMMKISGEVSATCFIQFMDTSASNRGSRPR